MVTAGEGILPGSGEDGADADGDTTGTVDDPEREWIGVGVAAAVVAAVGLRSYIYGSVFRRGDVVLLSNDPYFYRYFVELIAAGADGPLDLGALLVRQKGTPLLFAVLSWFTELLGGDPTAAGWVLAWYPVLSAAVTVGLTYALATRVTGVRGVGVAAAALLALTPIHALRTALGFADHHAFDYPWLVATALLLAVLAAPDPERTRKRWITAGALGVVVAGQALSWVGAVLLFPPIGLYVEYRTLAALREGRGPLASLTLPVAGLWTGAALTLLAHLGLGWHPFYVAVIPGGLAAAATGVALIGEAVRRVSVPAVWTFLGIEAVVGTVALAAVSVTPQFGALLGAGVEYFDRVGASRVAEGLSLFAGPWGPITGPVSLFGLVLFLAVPGLAVATRAAVRDHPGAGVLAVYGWYLLTLAAVQRRFAGELSAFAAVLAGVALVALAVRLRVFSPVALFGDAGDGRRALTVDTERAVPGIYVLLAVVVLVAAASTVLVPIKHNQAVVSGDAHDAARQMDDYAERHDLRFPQNRVLSWWGSYRMYNYFVNEYSIPSLRYSYGRSNYMDALAATDTTAVYEQHAGQVGFLVTTDDRQPLVSVVNGSTGVSLYARLHHDFGSETAATAAVEHYRAVYASADGSVKAFHLVPGATVTGTATPDAAVILSTTVEITGRPVEYRQTVTADADGNYSATVPYPGEYAVDTGTGRVTVPETAVLEGRTVNATARR